MERTNRPRGAGHLRYSPTVIPGSRCGPRSNSQIGCRKWSAYTLRYIPIIAAYLPSLAKRDLGNCSYSLWRYSRVISYESRIWWIFWQFADQARFYVKRSNKLELFLTSPYICFCVYMYVAYNYRARTHPLRQKKKNIILFRGVFSPGLGALFL